MQTNKFRRWLAVPALAATAAALPLTIGSAGTLEVQDACAQTGTCKGSTGDICFVNGVGFWDRAWVSGGG
jgi:hypothetical protein